MLLGADGVRAGTCDELPPTADCLPSEIDLIGADIAFGRDGSLFVTTGSGGGREQVENVVFEAQEVRSLAGKILRVTRDGRGLASNPFFDGDVRSNQSKVWALGFRNPFRLALDPRGIPVVGDVGWTSADEVDVVRARGNFGWPCYEGTARTREYRSSERCEAMYAEGTSVVEPAIEIRHTGVNAVTGGVFVSGSRYPQKFRGYYYADWAQSWIRYARSGTWRPLEFAEDAGGPVQLRVGQVGSVLPCA